jgi:DNA modification methylase
MIQRSKTMLKLGNSFELIRGITDESIDLTVTSPPYNIGKDYETRSELSAYLREYEAFARTLFAKTSDRGNLCWQVGNYVEDGEVYPLDIFFYRLFKDAGFQLRNRIIWHFEHGLHARRRLSGRYETILWFSKSDNYVFNLDSIRVPSKYPGKRAFKGIKKGHPSGNPLGKNPSDFWGDLTLEQWQRLEFDWNGGVWEIPNVKANHPEKTEHPCQFPVELAQRCVLGLSAPEATVFDPFLGVGSTAVAAQSLGRSFLGFEIDPNYLAVAEARLAALDAGTLRIRQLGRPIHQPSGRVSKAPAEWRGDPDLGLDS